MSGNERAVDTASVSKILSQNVSQYTDFYRGKTELKLRLPPYSNAKSQMFAVIPLVNTKPKLSNQKGKFLC